MKPVIIIAEAGVNHNGDVATAKELIDVAAEAGADYVKFQTFKAAKLVSREAKRAAYQERNQPGENSQYEMLRKLELSEEDHRVLFTYSGQRSIKFLSTGFDEESIDFLDLLGIDIFKIPSGEITNKPYLAHIASKKKRVIVSTGMATLDEVRQAVDVLIKEGLDKNDISILHCTTDYPTSMKDVNLLAIKTMQEELGMETGYSDHTLGIEVPIAAVSMGAIIIEKHFTLSNQMNGPDHKASLEPAELKAMVTGIRNIEQALSGDGIKKPTEAELLNRSVARKSIYISRDIKAGQEITLQDIIMLRPGDGVSPMQVDQIIGKTAKSDLSVFHKLKMSDIK